MSLHVRLYNNFWTHIKTARLRALLGNDAFWVVPRIWSYAAENQPDGDFSGYSATELAYQIGYDKDAPIMIEALHQAGFMHEFKLVNWKEKNGFHHSFSERAKIAAKARWSGSKEESTKEERKRDDMIRYDMTQALPEAMHGDATSNAPSINEPKRSVFKAPTISEIEEYARSIGFSVDAGQFVDYYQTRGWKLKGGVSMKDWRAAVRTWKRTQEIQIKPFVKLKDIRPSLSDLEAKL